MTASALYTGVVRHRRHSAHASDFQYPVWYLYLDLDELPSLLGGKLTRRRPGPVRVRRRDLLGGADGGKLDSAVRGAIADGTGIRPSPGRIRVLTQPRQFGLCFNPVSFYYAFDECERLDAMVAEVTNTPWGHRQAYVLRGADGVSSGSSPVVLRGVHQKSLRVSPFQPMERNHRWAASTPGETLSIHIENGPPGEAAPDFDATLSLRRRELTPGTLRRAVARQPGGPLRVMALIYRHALALKLRGAPYYPEAVSDMEAYR